MAARVAQHAAELQENSERRQKIDEKYKSDLNERSTRNNEQIASIKREHQESLTALHKQLEENRTELTKVITQYEDKQREEDEAHKARLDEQLNIYSTQIGANTDKLNAFTEARTAEVKSLAASFEADRQRL